MTPSRHTSKTERETALNPTFAPCSIDRQRIGRKARNAIAFVGERDRERRLKSEVA